MSGSRVLTRNLFLRSLLVAGSAPQAGTRRAPPPAPTWRSSVPASPGLWPPSIWPGRQPGHGVRGARAGLWRQHPQCGLCGTHPEARVRRDLMESHGLAFATQIYGELMEAFLAVKETVESEKHRLPLQSARTAPAGHEFSHVRGNGPRILAARETSGRTLHHGQPVATGARDRHRALFRRRQDRRITPAFIPASTTRGCSTPRGLPASPLPPVRRFRALPRDGDGFVVDDLRGEALAARDVIMATNGYSGRCLALAQAPGDPVRCLSDGVAGTLIPSSSGNCFRATGPASTGTSTSTWIRRAPGEPSRIVFGGLTGGRNQDLRSWQNGCTAARADIPGAFAFALRPCVDRQVRRHLRSFSPSSAAMMDPLRRRLLLRRRAHGHAVRPETRQAHSRPEGRRQRV